MSQEEVDKRYMEEENIPGPNHHAYIFVNSQTREAWLRAFDKAQEEVLILCYVWVDRDLTDEVISVHERGVQVYIILDKAEFLKNVKKEVRIF